MSTMIYFFDVLIQGKLFKLKLPSFLYTATIVLISRFSSIESLPLHVGITIDYVTGT